MQSAPSSLLLCGRPDTANGRMWALLPFDRPAGPAGSTGERHGRVRILFFPWAPDYASRNVFGGGFWGNTHLVQRRGPGVVGSRPSSCPNAPDFRWRGRMGVEPTGAG